MNILDLLSVSCENLPLNRPTVIEMQSRLHWSVYPFHLIAPVHVCFRGCESETLDFFAFLLKRDSKSGFYKSPSHDWEPDFPAWHPTRT